MNQRKLAERFADGARTGRCGNVFIDGDRIYSYGYHFVIAERKDFANFNVTTRKYSNSTSRQVYKVRSTLIAKGKLLTMKDIESNLDNSLNRTRHGV